MFSKLSLTFIWPFFKEERKILLQMLIEKQVTKCLKKKKAGHEKQSLLFEQMKVQDISIRELAEKADVSPTAIQKIRSKASQKKSSLQHLLLCFVV